jgi:hypothetical protein
MADTTTRKFDLVVGTTYNGGGLKNAAADVAKLRKELSLPVMGPLTRDDQLAESMARHSIRRVQLQRERNDIYRLDAIQRPEFDFSDVRGQGVDITRLRGGRAPQTNAERVAAKREEGLSQQAEHFGKALKLFGALTIAEQVGQGLQKLPAVADKFHQDLRAGATKTEAFATAMAEVLPGIGSLAKGFRSLGDFVHDLRNPVEAEQRRKREEQQDLRDQQQAIKDKRDAARQPILQAGLDAAIDAGDRYRLVGIKGNAREREQAQLAHDKEIRRLDKIFADRGKLSPDQQNVLKGQIAAGKAVADAELNDQIAELEKGYQAKVEADRREHLDRLQGMGDEARTAELESQGRFLESKRLAISKEADREKEDARRRFEDAKKDPDRDPDKAFAAFSGEVDAANRRRRAKLAAVDKQNQREVEDADEQHKQRLLAADSDVAVRRLQLAGQRLDAEKLAAKQGYEARLSEIKTNLDKEIEAHKEREPALRKQAAEDARAAAESFGLSMEEIQQRKHDEFRPAFPGEIHGSAGILTGTVGQGNGIDSILADSAKQQAQAAAAQLKATLEQNAKIAELIAAISSGNLGVVGSN